MPRCRRAERVCFLTGSGRNLAAKLVLSGVEGNAKALKIGKLALDLDAKVGESAVKARIESPVAADMAAQTLALEKLAGSLDLANPQMPMKQLKLPLSGSLRADSTSPSSHRWRWASTSTSTRSTSTSTCRPKKRRRRLPPARPPRARMPQPTSWTFPR